MEETVALVLVSLVLGLIIGFLIKTESVVAPYKRAIEDLEEAIGHYKKVVNHYREMLGEDEKWKNSDWPEDEVN